MKPLQQKILLVLAPVILGAVVWITPLGLKAWADDIYQPIGEYQTERQATLDQIEDIDMQMTIDDTEIAYADDDREKAKWITIKNIHKRKKEELKEKLKPSG